MGQTTGVSRGGANNPGGQNNNGGQGHQQVYPQQNNGNRR